MGSGTFREDTDMKYGQFLAQVYRENKRYINFCITLCMVFSILFFGKLSAVNAIDIEGSVVVGGADLSVRPLLPSCRRGSSAASTFRG